MNQDVLLLSLLFAITLAAFIGAVNAKGTPRVVVSYLLAILCLCISIFNLSQYIVTLDKKSAIDVAAEAERAAQLAVNSKLDEQQAKVQQDEAQRQSQLQLAKEQYVSAAKPLAASALQLANTLDGTFLGNVAEMSDSQYESLKARANSALAGARRLKSQFSQLNEPPGNLGQSHQNLENGIDALTNACANYERFFHAENETEEEQRRQAFKGGAKRAVGLLASVQREL